jgi:signal peptidase I
MEKAIIIKDMRGIFAFFWEILKTVIIALLIVIPIRYFIFQPFLVNGQSMEPNFENGDYLIVDEISYHFRQPKRGEVIVFRYPFDPSKRFIKRIIGLPGETVEIEDGKILISGKVLDEGSYLPKDTFTQSMGIQKITLRDGEYFVLGDNRLSSSDSRSWGPLPRKNIIGRVLFRAFPLKSFTKIPLPQY